MSWLALACAVMLAASPASAQSRVQIQEVVVGFDGSWKVGQWAPIRALVKFPKASRAVLQVSCVDADENLTSIPSEVHTVTAGQAWIYGSFKAGRLQGDLLVEMRLQTPSQLSARQEELLRELAELEGKEIKERKGFFDRVRESLNRL